MDLVWKLMQENTELRLEIDRMKKEYQPPQSMDEKREIRRQRAEEAVALIPVGKLAQKGGVFTTTQLDFINEKGLSKGKLYRTMKKYGDVQEALICAAEELY